MEGPSVAAIVCRTLTGDYLWSCTLIIHRKLFKGIKLNKIVVGITKEKLFCV